MKTIIFNNVKLENKNGPKEEVPTLTVTTGDHCSPQMVLQEYFGPDTDVLNYEYEVAQ